MGGVLTDGGDVGGSAVGMVQPEVAPPQNIAPPAGLVSGTTGTISHPNAGPSAGVERATVARSSRGRSTPEVFDMAMGE
eukprot:868617-Alexandrium_andersonii.AAC.1